jgi:hypothetical protein
MTSTTGSDLPPSTRFGRLAFTRITLTLLVAALCAGCGNSVPPAEADEDRVTLTYICTETGAVERGPQQAWPYLNPATGKTTFVLHLYSPQAGRWIPVPPPTAMGGNPLAMRCPQTGGPLSTEGPEPSSATLRKSTGGRSVSSPAVRANVGK